MGELVRIRDAMLAEVRAHYTDKQVTTVAWHDGEFDLKAIERYSRGAPAIIFSFGDSNVSKRGGHVFIGIEIVAVLLTRAMESLDRTTWILNLTETFLQLLHSNTWADRAPSTSKTVNAYSDSLDRLGLSMCVVQWDDVVELPDDTALSTLDDFLLAHGTLHTGEQETEQLITIPNEVE